MDYVQRTIQAYDNAADKYAATTDSMVNDREMDIMLSFLSGKHAKVLDLGCGPGRDTKVLSDKGYSVIGVDLSKEFIKKAQKLHPGLEFQLMDVRSLTFANSTFDAVWANAVLLHLNEKDLPTALKEIHRVLKTGGVVAMSFKEGAGEKEVLETFTTDLSRFYNFKTQESLNSLLESCGFQIVKSFVINERERFGPDKRDLNWIWSLAKKPSSSTARGTGTLEKK